ncbi:MAG: class I SAM-dependent methyltransferase [Gammaproteobacteria bacterium]|nr:class I SAM-dependent methyltransferase [Gammaproteobacteria bacterium]
MNDARKWDRIHGAQQSDPPRPSAVLAEFEHLLPPGGDALDVACGRGGNALLLAVRGLSTCAWDISTVALAALNKLAADAGVHIHTECRDVTTDPPEPAGRDVIVVSHFLDRPLIPHLIAALRPGGLIFYQTFVRDAVDAFGPSNPDYRLGANELLALFRPLRILAYRDEGATGDIRRGWRNEAMLIGRKE